MKKNRNKKCNRLATHVVLFNAKNRMYKQNTYTHMHKVKLKTLYFNFDSPLQIKAFSPFHLEETTNHWSLSAWWAYGLVNSRAVCQLIMRVHTPKLEYKLVHLYS